MLAFYTNSQLTKMVSQAYPKKFLCSLNNNPVSSYLYLADPFFATCSIQASVNASIIHITDTSEFLSSGTAVIFHGNSSLTISYTGKNQTSLTGVTGNSNITFVGDVIKPHKIYKSDSNISFIPNGIDTQNINVSLSLDNINFNFPGTPIILNKFSYDNILDSPIVIYIQLQSKLLIPKEFLNFYLLSNIFYVRDFNDPSVINPSEIGQNIIGNLYLYEQNQFINNNIRILPLARKASSTLPGFIIGDYKWRDNSNENAVVLSPTKWDSDISNITSNKFQSGIGWDKDLQPKALINEGNSVFLNILGGAYFDVSSEFYLPTDPILDVFTNSEINLSLSKTPKKTTPIFVGNWILDNKKYFIKFNNYRYIANGQFDTNQDFLLRHPYQFIKTNDNTLQLNSLVQSTIVYLGNLTGNKIDYFDIPIFPIAGIQRIYVDRGLGNPSLVVSNFQIDADNNLIKVIGQDGWDTSVDNAFEGEAVYAIINPGIAVLYDQSQVSMRQLPPDLNPAYSGVTSGYLYLQHTLKRPTSISLSCDKPRIVIPATYDSIIDLIAYGPVHYNGDYALLIGYAIDDTGLPVTNYDLEIVVDNSFSGLINYKDPTIETVSLKTGSDGKVNFIFTPNPNFGYYIPTTIASGGLAGLTTTNTTNDTIILPVDLAIGQVYDNFDSWLVSLYTIYNNDPYWGSTTANISLGETPFITSGTSGTLSFKTNGVKLQSVDSINNLIHPINALDIHGNSYTNINFTGNVNRIVFNTSIPVGTATAGFFITFLQRVTIKLHAPNTNVYSNSILIEMEPAPLINEDVYLILDDQTNGLLNQYRLGKSI